MKGKYNMNTKQNLFTEEELAKVTDEAERKHLIECAQDQSKIDMKYMEIMSKYDLWEKGKRSRYFHATTHGFVVAAEHMPDTCTNCPFWLTDLEMQEDGMCFLTGEVIPTPERTCDTKVMGNCPILPLNRLKKKKTRKEKKQWRT